MIDMLPRILKSCVSYMFVNNTPDVVNFAGACGMVECWGPLVFGRSIFKILDERIGNYFIYMLMKQFR